MPKAKPMSKNPAYPDAHPTAPGGMSEKALAKELIEKHGYDERSVKQMKWPEKIDAVAAGRRERELEASATAVAQSIADRHGADVFSKPEMEVQGKVVLGVVAETEEPEDEDMFDDLADLDEYDENEDAGFDAPHPDDTEAEAGKYGPQPEDYRGDGSHEDTDDIEAEWADAMDERDRAEMEALAAAPKSLLIKNPDNLDYIFDGHAGAGPSASERWIHCTASLGASRAFLETLTINQQRDWAKANLAARQGTTAHAAAEIEALRILGHASDEEVDNTLLELSINPDEAGEAYDDTMAEWIEEYTDLIASYASDRGEGNIMIEARVTAVIPLTDMHDDEYHEIPGSADCIVMPPADPEAEGYGELVVADLKYGNGIDVSVEENPQVRIYALGALGALVDEEGVLIAHVDKLVYHIAQPRLGGIKTWSEPLDDLLKWRDEVLAPALTRALFGTPEGATFVPGEQQCQFCPARGNCAALAEARIAEAAELFTVVQDHEHEHGVGSIPETGELTDERLGTLLAQAMGLAKITEELKAEAQRRLYRGGSVPGYHLVNYQPARHWAEGAEDALNPEAHSDEGAVLKRKLRERLWKVEPQLLSPTQALALFKKEGGKEALAKIEKELEPLIVKPDMRPVIAPVTDRRKAWTGVPPEQMFTVVEDDDL